MPAEVVLHPPERLLRYQEQISEGWRAFFDNKDSSANPYPPGIRHDAWRWGFFEGMDYGN